MGEAMRSMRARLLEEVALWSRPCSRCARSTVHDEILPDVLQCRECLECSGPLQERLREAIRRLPSDTRRMANAH